VKRARARECVQEVLSHRAVATDDRGQQHEGDDGGDHDGARHEGPVVERSRLEGGPASDFVLRLDQRHDGVIAAFT